MQTADVVFVAAMPCERDAIVAAFADREEALVLGRRCVFGRLGEARAAVVLCGVGKVNAATAVQLAADRFGMRCVVTAGVAGGLRPAMRVGEVYAVKDAVAYDFDLSQVSAVAVGQMEEFPERALPFSVPDGWAAERLATGDHFRDDDADYPLLVDDLAAGLRDMEGAAVAHAALRADVAVAGLKAVSNVRGAGSMTGQYAQCRDKALAALARAVPPFCAALVRRRATCYTP